MFLYPVPRQDSKTVLSASSALILNTYEIRSKVTAAKGHIKQVKPLQLYCDYAVSTALRIQHTCSSVDIKPAAGQRKERNGCIQTKGFIGKAYSKKKK